MSRPQLSDCQRATVLTIMRRVELEHRVVVKSVRFAAIGDGVFLITNVILYPRFAA